MPRFFLHVLNGRELREDPEGQEFPDPDAALAEAVASARDLVAYGILRNDDVSGRSFLIRDENQQTVATVPFDDGREPQPVVRITHNGRRTKGVCDGGGSFLIGPK